MKLKLLDHVNYMIVKFNQNRTIPKEFNAIKEFKSIIYTSEECSMIVPEDTLDTSEALSVEKGWFIMQIVGELDFSLVGILAQLATPLADNHISIFALSTYNTDYLLVKNTDKKRAIHVLQKEKHSFEKNDIV